MLLNKILLLLFSWRGPEYVLRGLLPTFSSGLSFTNILTNLVTNGDPTEQQISFDNPPEEARLNITQLITKHGYPVQEHVVTTEDGYVLKIQRIPNDRSSRRNIVVFLMHGIMDSSDSWILQGPDRALAYILAREGFDVWLGNARGNKHSLSHIRLKPNEPQFWKFTWDEIGMYDIPAMIDYVLNTTDEKSLYYIGHSQGTTSFFVTTSLRPEYNDKFRMMFALSPVAWMSHVRSPVVKLFSPAYKIFESFLSTLNIYTPITEYFHTISVLTCSFLANCDNLLYMLIGDNHKLINATMMPVIFGHMPTSASTMQFMHYGQLVQSGSFSRYDYGEESNLLKYGVKTPPEYDVGRISAPVSLYYSDNDWLSAPFDVAMLKNNLMNVSDYYCALNFNHIDFLYAYSARDVIYSRIVKQILQFENTIQ